MNIIVFSKDRGCQLELFLRSLKKRFVEYDEKRVSVLYKASDSFFVSGYEKTKKLFPRLNWVEEKSFKNDLLPLIKKEIYTVFFTDDDVFVNDFSLKNDRFLNFTKLRECACFSLRLNENLTYSYVDDKPILRKPCFNKGVFTYRGFGNYYGYAMSLDGHIFRTEDILPLIQRLKFNNPNTLEYQLSINSIKSKMICCEKSVIVNNPCNRVQGVYSNKSENVSVKDINEKYLQNQRLILDIYENVEIKCPHQVFELSFEDDRIMKNVISFSLYGNIKKFNVGLIKNIELAKTIYKDWKIYVFHDNSVSKELLNTVKNQCVLINVEEQYFKMPGMFWRFLVHDFDIDRFIIRDLDSRISEREKEAVDEWIKSNKTLHIMRDHPHHKFHILGGMWGMKKDQNLNMKNVIQKFIKEKKFETGSRNLDQEFLRDCIYQNYDKIIHSSIVFLNDDSVPFPSNLKDFRFVGEQFNEKEEREYQWELWKNVQEIKR